jgi:hypothetical protein
MKTLEIQNRVPLKVSKSVWTGRVISSICILFLLVDAIFKMILNPYYVEGTSQLGWNVQSVQPIGAVLLICTIIYCIPRLAFLGALLLTGFLGGAIATMARIGEPFYFPFIFAILIWTGLYLRDERLRRFLQNK